METDRGRVEALYRRYGSVVYHRCKAILRNDEEAMDITQETFAKVITSYSAFRGEASPLTWIYRISTNLCLNAIRDRKGRMERLDTGLAEGRFHHEGKDPHETIAKKDLVMSLLSFFDEKTQALVLYRYFDGMTQEEMARITGLSIPTVRKRLQGFLDGAHKRLSATCLAALTETEGGR